MDSIDARAQVKRAYELSRVQLGLRAALPVVAMTALSISLSGRIATTLALGALLFVFATVLRARGQAPGRALVPGLLAGSAPLLIPLMLRGAGHCCINGACMPVCMAGCIAGGFIAGIALGFATAREPEQRGTFLLSATAVAGLAGMLGCTISGMSGVAGMTFAMILTSVPVSLAARARA